MCDSVPIYDILQLRLQLTLNRNECLLTGFEYDLMINSYRFTFRVTLYTGETGRERRVRPLSHFCGRGLVGDLQGGPKSKPPQFFKKILLKIANEIRFLRKVKA